MGPSLKAHHHIIPWGTLRTPMVHQHHSLGDTLPSRFIIIIIIPWGTPFPQGSSSSSFLGGHPSLKAHHYIIPWGTLRTPMVHHHYHHHSLGDTLPSRFIIIIIPWGTPFPQGSSSFLGGHPSLKAHRHIIPWGTLRT